MTARIGRALTLMVFASCLVAISVLGVHGQEILAKGVPYVVQRAHLD